MRRADLTAGQHPASSQEEVKVVAQKVEIPGAIIHFQVDYDNPQNQITLHAAHSSGWDASEWLREYDTPLNSERPVGMVSGSADIHPLGRYVISGEKGEVDWENSRVIRDPDELQQLTWTVAINTYNEHTTSKKIDNLYWNSWGCSAERLSDFLVKLYENYPNRNLRLDEVLKVTQEGRPANICRLVTDSKEEMAIADSYKFDPGYFGNSIQFVPRTHSNGSSTDGYIICTVLSDNPEKSEI